MIINNIQDLNTISRFDIRFAKTKRLSLLATANTGVGYSPLCLCMTPDPILITSHSKDITIAKTLQCIWAAGKRPLQRQSEDICEDSRGWQVGRTAPQRGIEKETSRRHRGFRKNDELNKCKVSIIFQDQ